MLRGVPVVGPALQALSDGKARLPLKKGGLGHTSAAMFSPAAFYATYTQHAFHEQVGPDRMFMQELDFARALLTPSLPQAALDLLADPCVQGAPREAAAIDHPGAPDTGSRRSEGLCSGSLPSPLMSSCLLSWSSRPRLVLLLTIGTTSPAWDSTSPSPAPPHAEKCDSRPWPGYAISRTKLTRAATAATSSAIAILFMLMPVINPQNQKLRTDMTRSSWCALSWSRRLATAGFWLSQESQLWERGLTRASGEATCFLGMSLSLSTSTMWRMTWSCIHSRTWTMASVSTIHTRLVRLWRRSRSSTIARWPWWERWRVSCWPPEGDLFALWMGLLAFWRLARLPPPSGVSGTTVSRHSCCPSGFGSGLGHRFRLRSCKATLYAYSVGL